MAPTVNLHMKKSFYLNIFLGVLPHKELTSVLARRRAEGHELSEVADPAFGIQPIIERGIGVWPALDFSKLGLKAAAIPSVSTGVYFGDQEANKILNDKLKLC